MKKILAKSLALIFAAALCAMLCACASSGDTGKDGAHEHDLTKNSAVANTCTENGNIEHYACRDCGKLFLDSEGKNEIDSVTVPASHVGGTEVSGAKTPTEDSEGYTGDTYCLGCGAKLDSGEVIEMLGHTHNMQKTESAPATCLTNGNIEYWSCSKCNKLYSDETGDREISEEDTVVAAGHKIEINECTVCDYRFTAGLSFELNGDGRSYSLVGIGTAEDRDIIIPSVYEGYPVTVIRRSALCDLASVTSVYIPAAVKRIYGGAFTNSESVTVYCEASSCPSEWDTSWNNTNFTSLPVVWDCENNDVADDGYIYTVVDDVRYALKEGKAEVVRQITSITVAEIPSELTYKGVVYNVTSIAAKAFYGCRELLGITIPEGVASVGANAFDKCGKISSITIPSTVTTIGYAAFRDTVGVREIYFNAASLVGLSLSSNVFANSGADTDGIKLSVGKSVTKLPAYLFTCSDYEEPKIVSVDFEADSACTAIGQSAFEDCEYLTTITVPSAVVLIGNSTFKGCVNLTEIYYNAVRASDLSSGNQVFADAGKEGTGIRVIVGKEVERLPACLFNPNSATTAYNPNIVSLDFESGSVCEYIGENLFRDSSTLMYAKVPSSVTFIGSCAFRECRRLVIYCEVAYKPSGWNDSWSASPYSPVVWDCENKDVATDGNIYTEIDGVRYALNGSTATLVRQNVNIVTVNIPASVTYKNKVYNVTAIKIGETFTGCNRLTDITVDEENTVYKSIDGNLYSKDGEILWQYAVGKSDACFTVLDGVEYIAEYAFYNCLNLARIDIPASVFVIEDSAISAYDRLNLTIYCEAASKPAGWEEWWNSGACPVVFDSKNNDVADDGNVYVIQDGVRYVLGGEILAVTYQPVGVKHTVIPSEVVLDGKAYRVTEILPDAFIYCSDLKSIVISNTVTLIGANAFQGCFSLTDVYYTGTEEEWNALIANYTNIDFAGVNVYFNYAAE